MKLKEMSTDELMTGLREEFSSQQLSSVSDKLTNLIKTSETMEQLIAKVYEAVNVEIEESQLKTNEKINRLDTRKDVL